MRSRINESNGYRNKYTYTRVFFVKAKIHYKKVCRKGHDNNIILSSNGVFQRYRETRSSVRNSTTVKSKANVSDDLQDSDFQILIQTTMKDGDNILTKEQLLMHVELMIEIATFTITENSR